MIISKEKTEYFVYAFIFEYSQVIVEYCQYLRSSLGWKEFMFDVVGQRWRFRDPSVVLMLKNKFPGLYIEPEINKELVEYVKQHEDQKKQEAKVKKIQEAKISSLNSIKGIKGEFYPYQFLGVEFLFNSGGRALLADSPGVGKTAQVLGYFLYAGHKRILVVCPASVKFSWQNEVQKWTKLKSFVVGPKTDLGDIPHEVNVVIVNYDLLKRFYNELMKYKWDCLTLDEAHFVKNSTAIRTKIIKQLSKEIPSVILLTGTPVLNRPIELFNLLNIIDSKTWGNWYQFAVRYADGHQGFWGFEAKGASNIDELRSRISKYFLRRTKEEVLTHLPPKNRITVPVELASDFRKEYRMVSCDLIKYLKDHKGKTDIEVAGSVQAETLTRLSLLRQINSMGKLVAVKELIQNIIETGEKVIVFSCFNQPLKDLHDSFQTESVLLLGSTKVEGRGELVKKFQEDTGTKIFFGGTKSAGVGITLTAASNVIFLDYDFVPASMEQAENRAHRIGAKYESLNIYQMISPNTIDVFMKEMIDSKQEIVDQLIEGKFVKNVPSVMERMIEDIAKSIKIKK